MAYGAQELSLIQFGWESLDSPITDEFLKKAMIFTLKLDSIYISITVLRLNLPPDHLQSLQMWFKGSVFVGQ